MVVCLVVRPWHSAHRRDSVLSIAQWPGRLVVSLPEYLSGWVHPPQISAGMMFFSLFAYQPLALILAAITSVRGWKDSSRRVVRLSLWMFIALLLALVYPSIRSVIWSGCSSRYGRSPRSNWRVWWMFFRKNGGR